MSNWLETPSPSGSLQAQGKVIDTVFLGTHIAGIAERIPVLVRLIGVVEINAIVILIQDPVFIAPIPLACIAYAVRKRIVLIVDKVLLVRVIGATTIVAEISDPVPVGVGLVGAGSGRLSHLGARTIIDSVGNAVPIVISLARVSHPVPVAVFLVVLGGHQDASFFATFQERIGAIVSVTNRL